MDLINQNNFARIFVFIPALSNQALILRRGPSKIVGVYSWDLTNDHIIARQWLKGRIYEYLSDVSPDGKYFLYSANQRGWGHTAISRAPWIKAISFWRNGGFSGGGIFTNKKKYVLGDITDYNAKFISRELIDDKANSHILSEGIYHARLLKNNWILKTRTKNRAVYSKQLTQSEHLEKVVVNSYGFPKYEFHRLISKEMSVEKLDWHWADSKDGWLLWVQRGCLYRAQLSEGIEIKNSKMIYDFNPEQFREKAAPY